AVRRRRPAWRARPPLGPARRIPMHSAYAPVLRREHHRTVTTRRRPGPGRAPYLLPISCRNPDGWPDCHRRSESGSRRGPLSPHDEAPSLGPLSPAFASRYSLGNPLGPAAAVQNRSRRFCHALLLCGSASAAEAGSRTVKHAPRPTPSLRALSSPPISLARFALACSPKPWPSFLVVNPNSNSRFIDSALMPTP